MVRVIGGGGQKPAGVDNDHRRVRFRYSGLCQALGGKVLGQDSTVPPAEVPPARSPTADEGLQGILGRQPGGQ